MIRFTLLLFACCFAVSSGLAQGQLAPKRTLNTHRIAEKINLDGNMTEAAWQSAEVADQLYVTWPNPGRRATQATEVRMVYDDRALYFFFKCYAHPDSVMQRVTQRDQLENTDFVSVIIDTYRDGQNAVEFTVTPANVQFDSKYSVANANPNEGSPDGEDPSWDAVWHSAARLTDYGWAAEYAIPYAAIRFPKKAVQDWGIQFVRRCARQGESHAWNEIKPDVSGSLIQMGILRGVEGIKSPVRLSATPFVAAYANQQYQQPGTSWSTPYSVGMDVKYGLNDAFTLDATVIPDFGQVRSDQRILNLSPFEVRFQENRPFFTEGTELFNKGGFFYSRRVGSTPLHYGDPYNQLKSNEEVTRNPDRTLLLNATKVSGRTSSGLGIGVFNAVEAPSYATVTDMQEGGTREIQTASLTNKNIMVFDQNLKYNSSVTFINTNVTRSGADLDANLTGLVFNLKTPKQTYGLSGKVATSQRYAAGYRESGYTVSLDGSKTTGNFTYGGGYNLESTDYNPNDLGYLSSPNENGGFVWVNYSRYKPWWKLNNFWSSAWTEHSRLYQPNAWTSSAMGFNFGGNTKSFHNFGMNSSWIFRGQNDYFEAGTDDFSLFYHVPSMFRLGTWYNSDQRKKLMFNVFANHRWFDEAGRRSAYLNFGTRWRASDKLTLGAQIGYSIANNNVGNLAYSTGLQSTSVGYENIDPTDLNDGIFMGHRDIRGFENSLELTYAFTNRMNLAMFGRHYWNRVQYRSFELLQPDGTLRSLPYTGRDANGQALNDEAINIFNIDLIYTWRFAPGSDLLVVYKNSIFDYLSGDGTGYNYFYNAGRLAQYPGQNTFSFKVLYFLDYDRVKGGLRG
jgi:Domain of unknown function (DUF5916)/Carbohydrate family 9 binding domain-like